jgi:hypothetical protein
LFRARRLRRLEAVRRLRPLLREAEHLVPAQPQRHRALPEEQAVVVAPRLPPEERRQLVWVRVQDVAELLHRLSARET